MGISEAFSDLGFVRFYKSPFVEMVKCANWVLWLSILGWKYKDGLSLIGTVVFIWAASAGIT